MILIRYIYETPLLLLVVTFVQCTYNYKHETNYVSTVYSVAAVLCLQFMTHEEHHNITGHEVPGGE